MNCVLRLPICGHEIYSADRSPQDTGPWLAHVFVAFFMGLPCRWLKAPFSFQTLELGWSLSTTSLPIQKSYSEAECHVDVSLRVSLRIIIRCKWQIFHRKCFEKVLSSFRYLWETGEWSLKTVYIPGMLSHSWSPLLAWYHCIATAAITGHWDFQHWILMPMHKNPVLLDCLLNIHRMELEHPIEWS